MQEHFSVHQYDFDNEYEKLIIERYFNVEYVRTSTICYSMNNKILRRLKLLKLNFDEVSKIIQKIVKNSTPANAQEILEWRLSEELARSIDREILKSLFQYTEDISKECYLDSRTK